MEKKTIVLIHPVAESEGLLRTGRITFARKTTDIRESGNLVAHLSEFDGSQLRTKNRRGARARVMA
jgi:hypothetical protein